MEIESFLSSSTAHQHYCKKLEQYYNKEEIKDYLEKTREFEFKKLQDCFNKLDSTTNFSFINGLINSHKESIFISYCNHYYNLKKFNMTNELKYLENIFNSFSSKEIEDLIEKITLSYIMPGTCNSILYFCS